MKYMRIVNVVLVLGIMGLSFGSCEKDKYSTEPQLDFKEFTFNQGNNRMSFEEAPAVVLEVRDQEGDIGFIAGQDTAQVFIKNTFTGKEDSFYFPDLRAVAGNHFKAEIEIGLYSVMAGRDPTLFPMPFSDTLHFEIYVKDFEKNKSNVILTSEPFIYHTLP